MGRRKRSRSDKTKRTTGDRSSRSDAQSKEPRSSSTPNTVARPHEEIGSGAPREATELTRTTVDAASIDRHVAIAGIATIVAALASLSEPLAITPGDAAPSAPLALDWGFAGVAVAGLLAIVATRHVTLRSLHVVALLLAASCLAALEERTGVSPWHRGVLQFAGLGPDLLAALGIGFVLALPPGHRRARGLLLASTSLFAVFTFSPVPIHTGLAPGVLGLLVDGVDTDPSPWRWLGITLALAYLVLVAVWLSGRLCSTRTASVGIAGLVLAALGVFGTEGMVQPLGTWPWLGHGLVRLTVLALVALATASLSVARSNEATSPPRWRVEYTVVVCIVTTFVVVRLQAVHWAKTDENIYFYAAEMLSDGLLPYRDYFYAHPPLRVLLPAIVFTLFGFSLWSAQAIPLLAAIGSGLFLWRCAHHVLDARRAAIAGPLALGLHLANERTLIASAEMSGVNLACALACAGLWAAFAKRPQLAGASSGAALGVGMIATWYVPVAALACLVVSGRRALGRYAATFALTAGSMFVIGYAIGGDAFIDATFRFHTLKEPDHADYIAPTLQPFALLGAAWHDFGLLIDNGFLYKATFENPLAWLGAIAAPLLVVGPIVDDRLNRNPTRDPAWHRTAVLALAVPSGLGFLALLREHYTFYWASLIPPLALLTACAATLWLEQLVRHPKVTTAVVLTGALVPTTIVADWSWSSEPWGERQYAGRLDTYEWFPSSPSPVDGLDPIVATLVWHPQIVRGEFQDPSDRFLWMKKKSFSVAEEMAAWVVANTPPHATIAGASTYAPLIALLANRRIAANEVDTNAKVFSTGLRDLNDYWSRICDDDVQVIVSPPGGYFGREFVTTKSPVKGQFEVGKAFLDPYMAYGGKPMFLLRLEGNRTRCEVRR